MSTTQLPGGVAVVEHDNKSQSSSLVVQHDSLSNAPITLNGSAGPVPESGSLSFDLYTKQLGSHMAYGTEKGECPTMFMELDSLLGVSAHVVDRHHILKQSSIDSEDTRLRKICGAIADVERLFSDMSHEHQRETAKIVPYEKESLSSLGHQNHPGGLLYDVEEQTLAEELRRNDNRPSDAAWFNTSRVVCLTMLLAALVWQFVSLLS